MNYKKSFLLKILFATLVFISTLNAQKTEIPAIVTLDWLEKNIENPNLSIIDLRPKDAYDKSHIRNAVNVPGLKNLFDDKFFMPKLDFLKELFSKSGINSESLVLAYDNGEFIWAARLYWILETMGHKNVGILKGGFNKFMPLCFLSLIPCPEIISLLGSKFPFGRCSVRMIYL